MAYSVSLSSSSCFVTCKNTNYGISLANAGSRGSNQTARGIAGGSLFGEKMCNLTSFLVDVGGRVQVCGTLKEEVVSNF